MKIGGLQKFSLIDYPDRICAIIFTQGCNFRCGYCHNPELVLPEKFLPSLDQSKILTFLQTRQGKLDAIVITGGEPTLHQDLPAFIKKIKKLGFLVKLDTNGTNPKMLEQLLDKKLLNYIAMDIKAPLEKYQKVVCRLVNVNQIKKSIRLIIKSQIDYEFRTTVVAGQLTKADLIKIGEVIQGAKNYVLQRFVPTKANNPDFLQRKSYSKAWFQQAQKKLKNYVKVCITR